MIGARKQSPSESNSPYRSFAVKNPLVVVDCSSAAKAEVPAQHGGGRCSPQSGHPPSAIGEPRAMARTTAAGRRTVTVGDLVKYNDYHAEDRPAGAVFQGVTWNGPDESFAT